MKERFIQQRLTNDQRLSGIYLQRMRKKIQIDNTVLDLLLSKERSTQTVFLSVDVLQKIHRQNQAKNKGEIENE